jgi:uncharacterized protein (TIGR02328 family)
MRLWSYQLLPYLPRLQLVSQWRECCCIAKSITEKGTPNHILVNKIMDYPIDHFMTYCNLVAKEMYNRGYKCDTLRLTKWTNRLARKYTLVSSNDLFSEWHNDIYLRQSLYNLEEKALCQGIPADEWQRIYDRFKDFTPLQEVRL